MKTGHIVASIALGLLLVSSVVQAQELKSQGSQLVEALKFDEITWNIPKLGVDVVMDTLPNGIVLFMMEDHRLPVFNARGIIRTGSAYEPMDKRGLAGLVGTCMRLGGTESLDPDRLNEELEYIAASVETWMQAEAGNASLSCMSKDIARGLEILADVIMNPAFRQKELDLEKQKIRENIRRRNDSPGAICTREFNHLIYKDHHYGSILEWETVRDITRDELMDFHRKYFVPNNVWLGITGDFEIDDVRERLLSLFGRWEPADVDFPEIRAVDNEFTPGVFVIDRDLVQSNIAFGLLGVNKYTPDRWAISIMNYILGGGSFTSRLTAEVRSNLGLAYSVGSIFPTDSRDLGTFRAYCQTKTETTYKAINEMVNQIRRIREEPVTDHELGVAKEAFINRFVFGFTNPHSIVTNLMFLEYDGMPRDFYETYLDNVRAVKKEDIKRVAAEYLDPEKMTFLIVGNSAGFEAPLDEFGEVTVRELVQPAVD